MTGYARSAEAGSTAVWVIPVVVTLANVLLVVGVRAGPGAALAATGAATLALAATFRVVRSRRRARTPESTAEPRPYTEDLELTVWIGPTAKDDRVLERRRTYLDRELEQRTLTLISPYAGTDTDKVSITPEVRVTNAPIDASWMPIDITGRGIVHFVPGATAETLQWEIDYTIPGGLWGPLRSTGVDVFRYDVRTFRIGTFSIQFTFGESTGPISIRERNHLGTTGDIVDEPSGARSILWTSDSPAANTFYEWDICMNLSCESP